MKFHVSVATMSSYSFEDRGLKFSMKVHLIDMVKLPDQILEFFLGAKVIEL